MKERPILFSALMVRAILDGSKTQTRRVCKPAEGAGLAFVVDCGGGRFGDEEGDVSFVCPHGAPGDRLWVRETFMHEPADYCWEASVSIPSRPAVTQYRADFSGPTPGAVWTPSIHMPRSLSRIDLEVVGVRVERLQSISEADARAEGVRHAYGEPFDPEHTISDARRYALLWDEINGPGSWNANPWVWVVEFRRIKP